MSSGSDNNVKPLNPTCNLAATTKTSSSGRSTSKTGHQVSTIDAEKWAALMKEIWTDAAADNQAEKMAEFISSSAENGLNAAQIKDWLDYKMALNQLEMLQADSTPGDDYADLYHLSNYDLALKQKQLSAYKKQQAKHLEVTPVSSRSGGNVGSWVNQAIQQTGVSSEWAPALKWIINQESSGNPHAQNPSSTAYGLMQFLDSTWSNCGLKKTSDPVQQVAAGIEYIKQRYGTAETAKAFWQKNHWY